MIISSGRPSQIKILTISTHNINKTALLNSAQAVVWATRYYNYYKNKPSIVGQQNPQQFLKLILKALKINTGFRISHNVVTQ